MKTISKLLILGLLAIGLGAGLNYQYKKGISVIERFDERSVSRVIDYIDRQEKGDFPLVISTKGGSVLNGNQIARALERATARGALSFCMVEKYAMSMGFTVLQYCYHRVVDYGAILMQHMPHDGDGYENIRFTTKEESIGYSFIVLLNLGDESKRMGISNTKYLQRYMYSKYYRLPSQMCKDNVIDAYINVKMEYVSCLK